MEGEAIELYRKAAEQLAEARVRFSREWQIARAKSNSDMQATQIAIERTKDELTVCNALVRAAELTVELAVKGKR